MLAANTMHKVAAPMMERVGIPLLHIADATSSRIVAAGLRSQGLMATGSTMEQRFYTDRLAGVGLVR